LLASLLDGGIYYCIAGLVCFGIGCFSGWKSKGSERKKADEEVEIIRFLM